jgi:hypothetical protein
MLMTMDKADVILIGWNIVCIKTPSGEYGEIFVGYSVGDGLGRVSAAIQEFNKETGKGRTRSGSTYTVIGEPGVPHTDALYVLESQIGKARVTKELFSDESTGAVTFKYPIEKLETE